MPWISNEPIWDFTQSPLYINFKYPVTEVNWWKSDNHSIYKIQIVGIWMGKTWMHEEIITYEALEDSSQLVEDHINAQIQSRIQNHVPR